MILIKYDLEDPSFVHVDEAGVRPTTLVAQFPRVSRALRGGGSSPLAPGARSGRAVFEDEYIDPFDDEERNEPGLVIPAAVAALGGAFLISTLMIAGLPPLAGFIGKLAMMDALSGVGGWAAQAALKLDRPRSPVIAAAVMLLATLAAGGAWAAEASAWWASGLRPDVSSQGATVFALLAWQGLFAGICLLMGPFAALRWMFGHLSPKRPATFELIALFLAFTALQGAGTTLLVRLFPGVMS